MDMSSQFPSAPGDAEGEDALTGSGLRKQMRRSSWAVGILVLGLGVAAAVLPIGGAVVGTGHVGVESKVKRVTHPTGGVIAQLFVRNGDHVGPGQPLIRFDDSVTGNESVLAALTVSQLLAQKARLEAEQLGLGSVRFPDELTRSSDPGAQRAIADEQRLFALRQSEESGMRAQLDARMVQYRRQIAGYNAQILALQRQTALIEPERQGIRELWDKGLVTISRKNELERTAVDMQGSIGALQASIAQAEARITEAQEQRIQLGQTRRAEAGTQLAQINTALNEQRIRSVSATNTQDKSTVRASYAGVVDKLAFAAIGDVVRAAEPIMEIVPDNDNLIVEAAISPADIEQVRKGQPARIRFSSLNSTATPEIEGKVILVAADQSTSEDGKTSYFPVRVEISPASLKAWPELKLRAGMPAEIFIETGSRTMLSYLTKPLRDQLARAFRDN